MARSAGFAALFCVAVYLGRLTVMDGTSLSLVWPAAGVAALWFAVQREAGTRWLDRTALAVATFALNVLTGASPALAACFAGANLVQVEVFGALFRRWCPRAWGAGGGEPLTGLRQLARLLAAAVLATAAGAAIGPTSVWALTGHWSWLTAAVWMTRNTASVVLILAVGLRIGALRAQRGAPGAVPFRRPAGWGLVELVAAVAVSAGAYVLVFGAFDGLPLAFPLIALTVWVATRFDTTVVVVHDVAVGALAVVLTLAGHGPFAAVPDDATRAIVVQLYVCVLAAVGLALALGRDERDALVAQLHARAAEAEAERALADEQRVLAELAVAEAELRHELARAVTDTVDVGIVVADPDGRLVLFNRAAREWHGLDADASLDPHEHAGTYDLLAADGSTPLRAEDVPLQRVLAEGSVSGAEIVLAPAGRPARLVTCSGRTMERLDGTALGAVVAMADITADRAHQAALEALNADLRIAHAALAERSEQLAAVVGDLERSNTELAQFASIASHDLHSPLTVISGYLEMLGDVYGGALDEQGREWVATALRGTGRMKDLIDALLRYAQAGGDGVHRQRTDAADVFAQAVVDLRERMREAGARVSAHDLPELYCDPVLLRQLLQNLVANSLKYRSPERPCRVAVSAERTGDGWAFAVADNGVGIPPEQRRRVFAMFAQVDPAARTGHGIGLATCQRIVERHGGRIWAEETPGGGTTVRFTLPQRGAETPGPAAGEATGEAAGEAAAVRRPVRGASSPAPQRPRPEG